MFTGEIGVLHAKYEELRIQLHQKDAELALKDVMGKESLRLMLGALEKDITAKINSSISSMRDDGADAKRKHEEQFTLLAKQINILTSKIDSNPAEILKLWQGVEEGRIEIDKLGSEVIRYFARIENLERNWEEARAEWDATRQALTKHMAEARREDDGSLPAFINMRDVSASFVGRAGELAALDSYFATHALGIQVIGGLGGMGKTQVSLQYADKHREYYNDKIRWIMAETEITLDQSFREFAEDLGIKIEKLSLTEVVDKVYKRLNHQNQIAKGRTEADKILLIFDNVDSYEKIKDYLPNTASNNRAKSSGQVQHVLITTRNIREWELKATQGGVNFSLNVIRLEPFSEVDSIELIGKFVRGASLTDAKLLASTFGNIPLALTQALSFIQINDTDIQSYLAEYQSLKQKELSAGLLPTMLESDINHELDIYTTLSLNVESLKSLPLGEKAIKLLNLCGYLYADRIPEKLFSDLFTNKIEASKVLSILKGYSLVSVKQLEDGDKYIYIHRLLQDVLKMRTQESREEYLLEAGKLVHKAMNYNFNQVKEILTIAKPLVSHAEELIGHIGKNPGDNNELKQLMEYLYDDCGLVFDTSAEFSKALSAYQESLSIRKEIYGSRHSNVATSLNNIGEVYSDLGRNEEALKYHEESLSISKEIYGSRHLNVSTSLNNIGLLYKSLGRNDEALKYLEESLSISKEIYGSRHSDVATALNNIGNIYYSLGPNDEALKYLEESLSILKEIYASRHPDVASSLNNIGSVYSDLGRNEEALKYYEESLSISKEIYGSRHTSVATILNNIGALYSNLGRNDEALAFYQEALSIRREFLPETHEDVQNSLSWVKYLETSLKQAEVKKNSSVAKPENVILKDHSIKESTKKKCIISVVSSIKYDNDILNNEELLSAVIDTGNAMLLDNLIDLGEDKAIAAVIKEACLDFGAKQVIETIFGDMLSSIDKEVSKLNEINVTELDEINKEVFVSMADICIHLTGEV